MTSEQAPSPAEEWIKAFAERLLTTGTSAGITARRRELDEAGPLISQHAHDVLLTAVRRQRDELTAALRPGTRRQTAVPVLSPAGAR